MLLTAVRYEHFFCVCLFVYFFSVIHYLSMEGEQKHGCVRNLIGIVARMLFNVKMSMDL